MTPDPSIAFENGAPVPTVDPVYPGDEIEHRDEDLWEAQLIGFRLAICLFIEWIRNARTDKARRIRLEAVYFVFAPRAQNVTETAARLKVRRETFSRAVSHVQQVNQASLKRASMSRFGKVRA